jgi:hypothetical protein
VEIQPDLWIDSYRPGLQMQVSGHQLSDPTVATPSVTSIGNPFESFDRGLGDPKRVVVASSWIRKKPVTSKRLSGFVVHGTKLPNKSILYDETNLFERLG